MVIRGVCLEQFYDVFVKCDQPFTFPGPTPDPEGFLALGKRFKRQNLRVPGEQRLGLSCDDWNMYVEREESSPAIPFDDTIRRVRFSGDEDIFIKDIIALKMLYS